MVRVLVGTKPIACASAHSSVPIAIEAASAASRLSSRFDHVRRMIRMRSRAGQRDIEIADGEQIAEPRKVAEDDDIASSP